MEKTNEQIWAKLEEINKMVAQCCKNQLKISEAGKINDKVRNLMQFEPRRDKLMQFEPRRGEFVTCDENEYGNKWIMIWGGESDSGRFTNEIYGYCETLGYCSSGYCCTMTGDTFRPSTDAEKKRLLDKLSEDGKVWNPILMRIEDKAVRAICVNDPNVTGFKAGDFVVSKNGVVAIIQRYESVFASPVHPKGFRYKISATMSLLDHSKISFCGDLNFYYTDDYIDRVASESECCRMVSNLSKVSKRWDAQKMQVVDLEWTPKAGDVVNAGDGAIFLYKEKCTGGLDSYATLYHNTMYIGKSVRNYGLRPATREERCEFFSRLVKEGYKWNAKKLKLTKVEQKWEPKDGEFIVANDGTISILGKKETTGYFNVLCRLYKNGRLDSDPYGHYTPYFITRKATESERVTLLSALEKAGKTWNAELKRVEDIKPEVEGFKDGCYVTLDEEWVSMYRGVSAVKNAISDYCGTHINHGDFTDLTPATHRCYNSIRPSTQSEISRFNALLSHAKKRAEDAPTKVVELTMEQVCEKLGMNVKIIKK